MARPLPEIEARAVIAGGKVGHLGCIVKDEPYVVPIDYVIEGQTIYSHSLPGRKIQALRAHPRACLQVEQIEDDFHWRSAIAFGCFAEVTDNLERAEALRKLLDRFPMLTPVESRLAQDATPPEVIVFRIHIDRITGLAEE